MIVMAAEQFGKGGYPREYSAVYSPQECRATAKSPESRVFAGLRFPVALALRPCH